MNTNQKIEQEGTEKNSEDLPETFKDFVRKCSALELAVIIQDARACGDKATFDFAQAIMREHEKRLRKISELMSNQFAEAPEPSKRGSTDDFGV